MGNIPEKIQRKKIHSRVETAVAHLGSSKRRSPVLQEVSLAVKMLHARAWERGVLTPGAEMGIDGDWEKGRVWLEIETPISVNMRVLSSALLECCVCTSGAAADKEWNLLTASKTVFTIFARFGKGPSLVNCVLARIPGLTMMVPPSSTPAITTGHTIHNRLTTSYLTVCVPGPPTHRSQKSDHWGLIVAIKSKHAKTPRKTTDRKPIGWECRDPIGYNNEVRAVLNGNDGHFAQESRCETKDFIHCTAEHLKG